MTTPAAPTDRAAFERLYAANDRAILAFCLRRTPNPADAEEAAAETFVVAWRRIADAPSEDHRLAWLYAIARRILANQRRGGERRVRLIDRLRSQPAPATVLAHAGPVSAAVERLRPDDQELLRLVAWEDLSHAEIAVVLGISINAVAIRLYRARGRLAEELGKGSTPTRTSTGVKGRMFGRPRREHTE
ncbi:MAG: RNA polymerase sigma factor [Chloroflexota bacterium]|nr:RNA polymerase sigma factor [Chloroflexota bacterium]